MSDTEAAPNFLSFRLAVANELESHIFVRSGPSDNQSVRVIEPYTWGWVGLKIAEGIIAGAAGQAAINIIFGRPEKELARIITDAIRELKLFIVQVITEDRLREFEADTRNLQSLLLQWSNNKKNTGLLQNMRLLANRTTFQAHSLGLGAVPCFTVAANLNLAVIAELARVDRSERENLKARANELCRNAEVYPPMLAAYNEGRFSPLHQEPKHERPTETIGPKRDPFRYAEGEFYFYMDGRPVTCGHDAAEARAVYQSFKNSEYARLSSAILSPLFVSVDKWRMIAAGALQIPVADINP